MVLQMYVYDVFTLVIKFILQSPPPSSVLLPACHDAFIFNSHVHIPKENKRLIEFLEEKTSEIYQ